MTNKLKVMYWNYLKYVLKHKWYVFLECLKIMQPWHGITHDLSKFLPSEFFPYAKWFYGKTGDKDGFDVAWCLHQHRNKHHWDYWVKSDGKPVPVPPKYIMQMIADWRAMGRTFGDTAESFYIKNKDRMILHGETIKCLEKELEGLRK